jgi:putative oxidoreductase
MLDHGLTAARLLLAIVFLYSGVEKIVYFEAGLEEVRGFGLPWPRLCLALTIVTQLTGGILVATGYLAWLGALLLAGFTFAATLLGHRFWLFQGERFRHELTTTLEHVAIIGGLLLVGVLDVSASHPW